MNSFVLKIIAVAAMLIDHTAHALQSAGVMQQDRLFWLLRSVGRIAFPVFAFLLVEGFRKTSDRKKYLTRLLMFAAISQLPFSTLTSNINYTMSALSGVSFHVGRAMLLLPVCVVWYAVVCRRRADSSLVWVTAALLLSCMRLNAFGLELLTGSYNVFYTLAFGLAAMMLTEAIGKKTISPAAMAVSAAALALAAWKLLPSADYDFLGVILILGLYFGKGRKGAELYVLSAWSLLVYLLAMGSMELFSGAMAGTLLIMHYNGQRGRKMKYLFYAFYPAHMLVLSIIFQFIRK